MAPAARSALAGATAIAPRTWKLGRRELPTLEHEDARGQAADRLGERRRLEHDEVGATPDRQTVVREAENPRYAGAVLAGFLLSLPYWRALGLVTG